VLVVFHRAAVVDDQTATIEHCDDSRLIRSDDAFIDELRFDLTRHAETRRAGSEDDDALCGEPFAFDRQRAVEPRHYDRAGALDVVVERR
jgi:hypothetical protein